MMKKLISILLIVMMLLSMTAGLFVAGATEEFFAGGSGTEDDPYLIRTKYHLDNVRLYSEAHFKMIADILFDDGDFAEGGYFYNDGIGFSPIDDLRGTFDGDHHTIQNLLIKGNIYTVGVFAQNHGTIQNLGVLGGSLSGEYVGGIVGSNSGTVKNCYTTAKMSAANYVGGIASWNQGTIESCYNAADLFVTIGMPASDAAGIAVSNHGTISNCYNIGKITAATTAGIACYNYGVTEHCYNAGNLPDSGIVATNYGKVIQCYYIDTSDYGINYNDGNQEDVTVEKCTATQFSEPSTFVGFDFETVWTFDSSLTDYPAPVLQNVAHVQNHLEENVTDFAGGLGTWFSPFLISDKTHLDHVRNYLSAHFRMIEDIEFTDADFTDGGAFYNDGAGFDPIGNQQEKFTGFFDGNHHVIKNLYINNPTKTYVGLFAYNKGAIKNLGIDGGTVIGNDYVGGISASNSGANIDNCFNSATIKGQTVGGITASNDMGNINQCYNTGDVFGKSYTGGISARNMYATIQNCFNSGNVFGENTEVEYVGGITGDSAGTIQNCHNTGSVTAAGKVHSSYVGGITGYSYSYVIDCYNAGNILGHFAGGIVGSNASNVENCYNSAPVAGAHAAGGIAGENENTVTKCYNIGPIDDAPAHTEIGTESCIGGIVGRNDNGRAEISNCYNQGNVTASYAYLVTGVGGIVGYTDAIVYNCYNVGNTTASYAAGIAAFNYVNPIYNCYYLDSAEMGVNSGFSAGVKCTAEQMKNQETFHGFNFETIWNLDSAAQEFPTLQGLHVHQFDESRQCQDNGGHWNPCQDSSCQAKGNYSIHTESAIVEDIPSTCTANGKGHTVCTVCAIPIRQNISIPLQKHTAGKWKTVKEATASSVGMMEQRCTICNELIATKTISKKYPNPFVDVKKSDFYYTPVQWAVENNITSGTTPTTFAPAEACTRGQIATFLWRAAGQPRAKTSNNPFTDVKKSDYYYTAVLWAVGEGVTSGTSKTTFSPEEACTRGQIATFLWRANGGKKVNSANPFTDVSKSEYYYDAVLWAVKNNVTAGTSATTFSPAAPCTRGQIVTFLYRSYN